MDFVLYPSSLSPSEPLRLIDYGQVILNTSSRTESFTVKNQGEIPIQIGLQFPSPKKPFYASLSVEDPIFSLLPNEVCT